MINPSALFQSRFFQKEVWKNRALPIAATFIGAFALLLLIMLSIASSNTEFFDNYFIWLYAANVVTVSYTHLTLPTILRV